MTATKLEDRCAELVIKIQSIVLKKAKSVPLCRPKGLSDAEIHEIAALMARIHVEAPWLAAEERSA